VNIVHCTKCEGPIRCFKVKSEYGNYWASQYGRHSTSNVHRNVNGGSGNIVDIIHYIIIRNGRDGNILMI
jgi:hypothetical protein